MRAWPSLGLLLLCTSFWGCSESVSPRDLSASLDTVVDLSRDGAKDLDTGPRDIGPHDTTPGAPCGYKQTGQVLIVAPGITICMPQVVCTSETCPPPLGQCVGGRCVFKGGYKGIETLPEAWATHYCALKGGGCHGVTQIDFAEVNAAKIAASLGAPLCEDASPGASKCVGIAASSPMIVGNSQEAKDPATGTYTKLWGLGYTEASGLCYELVGPGGTVVVALTDRCGGYCRCNGSGYQECGPCVSAPDMAPHCACVGSVPGLFADCCGRNCPTPTKANCDWCASNNHPHFDLDTAGFNALCGSQATNGSCKLSKVHFFNCLNPKAWPPGGAGGCKAGSFFCTSAPTPNQVKLPNTNCCCNWNLKPQPDGTCA